MEGLPVRFQYPANQVRRTTVAVHLTGQQLEQIRERAKEMRLPTITFISLLLRVGLAEDIDNLKNIFKPLLTGYA